MVICITSAMPTMVMSEVNIELTMLSRISLNQRNALVQTSEACTMSSGIATQRRLRNSSRITVTSSPDEVHPRRLLSS